MYSCSTLPNGSLPKADETVFEAICGAQQEERSHQVRMYKTRHYHRTGSGSLPRTQRQYTHRMMYIDELLNLCAFVHHSWLAQLIRAPLQCSHPGHSPANGPAGIMIIPCLFKCMTLLPHMHKPAHTCWIGCTGRARGSSTQHTSSPASLSSSSSGRCVVVREGAGLMLCEVRLRVPGELEGLGTHST